MNKDYIDLSNIKNRKSRRNLRNAVISIIIFILIGGLLGYYFRFTDCGSDSSCFNNLAKECKKSKVLTLIGTNIYEFYVKGRDLGNINYCKVNVKVVDVLTVEPSIVELFKDTKMKCSVPKGELNNLIKFDDILKYCHGTLKEALYEKALKDLYSQVIQQLGLIVEKTTAFLNK